MNGYSRGLEELMQAFKHLQAARAHLSRDEALAISLESCMQFLAVLIADLTDKMKKP